MQHCFLEPKPPLLLLTQSRIQIIFPTLFYFKMALDRVLGVFGMGFLCGAGLRFTMLKWHLSSMCFLFSHVISLWTWDGIR